MKKIMVTWYGITDFKSSLGFEKSGPVIGALKAETYDKVVILAYTSLEKKDVSELNDASLFAGELQKVGPDSFEERADFVNRWCNTNCAHNNFKDYLSRELEAEGIKTQIIIRHVESLRHLNDSENIYIAENLAIEKAVATDPDASFTFYLSPGTPVMAFNWALSSMRFPRIQKRLLASPQSFKAPEEIALPQEWSEWESKNAKIDNELDVIFHLFGEQRIPSYLGMKSFNCPLHIFVNSSSFSPDVMEEFAQNGAKCYELPVDPFDPKQVVVELEKAIEKFPKNYRIGFNLTGGTKLMFAGASYVCRKVNGLPFYFDNRGNLMYLNDFSIHEAATVDEVKTFINLNMEKLTVTNTGEKPLEIPELDEETAQQLMRDCWKERNVLGANYKAFTLYQNRDETFRSFCISKSKIFAEYNQQSHKAMLRINGHEYSFLRFEQFGAFIIGKWFESHVFYIMKKLEEQGIVKDVRTGYEVALKNCSSPDRNKYQEFDVICTTGRRLIIIECKAGYVTADYVAKLSEQARDYGGIEGRGILLSCFKPASESVLEKIRSSKNIINIYGDAIKESFLKNAILDFN